jgi:hypothetical protein
MKKLLFTLAMLVTLLALWLASLVATQGVSLVTAREVAHGDLIDTMLPLAPVNKIADCEPKQSTTGPAPPLGVSPKGLATDDMPGGLTKTLPVPGYLWRHGCGPTALGMVIGYYDTQGYVDLFPGDAATQTSDVDQGIASQRNATNPGHYEDYSLPMDSGTPSILPDKSEPPDGDEHPSDSIADFMKTSWSSRGNRYGWSWSSDMGPAFISYVNSRNPSYYPEYQEYYMHYGTLNWGVLTQEIDNNRPMVFLVDTNADGLTDHFVAVIGYRSTPSNQYGCLDTWTPADVVRWCDFKEMASGQSWGISYAWSFSLTGDTTPPSGSILINGGDAWTNSNAVTLSLIYTDVLSGVDKVRYSNDGVWDSEPW